MNNKKKDEVKDKKDTVRHSPVRKLGKEAERKKEQEEKAKLLGEGLAGKAAKGILDRRRRDEELLNSL